MAVLTAQLCKAARALVDWKATDLSAKSGVPLDTLRSFESGRTKTLRAENDAAVRAALRVVGVVFLSPGDGVEGEGVELRSTSS